MKVHHLNCGTMRPPGTPALVCHVLLVETDNARQVQRLGFSRDDVRHIVITHFDLDHIGGLADFPAAQVHVTTAEIDGSIRSPS